MDIGEYPILCEYGFSDEPGHWDHWGAGFIATWPNEGSARGTVVIDDGRAFYGNFLFSTGPNTDAGGRRDTHCHLDVPMRHCSVSVDGRPMTVNGDVVAEGQCIHVRGRLGP